MNFVRNYKIWIAVSVMMAVLAGVGTVSAVQSYVDTVQVIAAAREIKPDEVPGTGSLAVVDVPRGNLYPDAVYSAGEIAGMVAKGYIPAGTILRKSMFMPLSAAGAAGRLSVMSENGEEFFAVAVPNSLYTTVAGVLQPENRVDIYARVKDEDSSPELLASDIQVIQAGSIATSDGQQQTQGVVIAVKQQELSRILPHLFGDQARLVFVLKPAGMTEKETPPVAGSESATSSAVESEENVPPDEDKGTSDAEEEGS